MFRYFHIRNLAWRVLIETKTNCLPVDIFKICRHYQIEIISYEHPLVKLLDKTKIRKNTTAIHIEALGMNFIACTNLVDEKVKRFAIAHELGHILLKHNSALNVEQKEFEANMFAARILSPLFVIKTLKLQSAHDLSQICQISLQSAEIRLKRYYLVEERKKFFSSRLEKKLKKQFNPFFKKKELNFEPNKSSNLCEIF